MKRRVWLVVCALLVAGSVLTACRPDPSSEAPPGASRPAGDGGGGRGAAPDGLSWRMDTSPFTFTQYFYGNWATNYLWKDQYDMKLIERKTGVRIDRRLAQGSDEDYLNTMIATGNLPDTIMLDWNNPAVAKLINQGLVYSMNELIDQYAPEFWNMLDPEMVQYHTVSGKLWYLPNMYEPKGRMTSGFPITSIRPWFIRKDLYAELGEPKIETTEDLRHVLEKIKKKHPELRPLGLDFFDVGKNGFQGSLSMDYLIDSFSPNLLEERIRDDRREVLYPMRNKGFIEAFRYVNSLCREGLFDPKLLITKQEQYSADLYDASFGVASQFIQDLYTKFNPAIKRSLGSDKAYIVLDGIAANGREPRYPVSRLLGWQGFFITKKAKDPDRIIRFAEYAWSDEGQMDLRYGKEGETYTMVDGLPQYKPDVHDMMVNDINAWFRKYGFEASTLLWRSGKIWDEANLRDQILTYPDMYNAAMKLSRFNYDDYALGMENLEPEGSSPEGVINAKVKILWNQTIPLLVMAKSDEEFDAVYASFLDQMDKIGAEQVEKVMYERHLLDLRKKGIQP